MRDLLFDFDKMKSRNNLTKSRIIAAKLDSVIGLQTIDKFISDIMSGKLDVALLYRISVEYDDKIGFHAAWILEKLCEKTPDYAVIFVEELMISFNRFTNKSTIRQYAKLISRLLKYDTKNGLNEELSDKLRNLCPDSLIEGCFNQLIDKTSPISVKQMCCEVLLQYKDKEVWIKEELQAFCEQLSIQSSAASRAYRKKLLKDLC